MQSRFSLQRCSAVTGAALLAAVLICLGGASNPDTNISAQTGEGQASAADEDTVPIMEGIFFVDIDSVLLAGSNILLAFEDTIPFTENSIDTLLVTAPRIKIEDVIRSIGERMESDRFRIQDHAYTYLSRAIVHYDKKEQASNKFTVYESAVRVCRDAQGNYNEAILWESEREYKDGEMVKETIADDIETSWRVTTEGVRAAQPFSLDSGDRYHYEILDRKLVGLNIVYKISFTPKSEFEGLSAGIVWIDYSDFVIRRIEAELTGNVPLPFILKGIPVYKIRRVQKDEFWVVDDVYAKIELHRNSLLKIPGEIEFFLKSQDHTINGIEYPDADEVGGGHER